MDMNKDRSPFVKKINLILGLSAAASFLGGCEEIKPTIVVTPNPDNTQPPPTEPIPSETPEAPVGAEATETSPYACAKDLPSKEDVANIPQSYPLTIDANNNLSGFPENTGLDPKDHVLPFVKAILNRQYADPLFRDVSVTFSQDPESKRWGFFASNPNGYLHNLVSYANGPDQFADYPLDLRGGVVNGKYAEVGVPEGYTVTTIWEKCGTEYLPFTIAVPTNPNFPTLSLDYDNLDIDSGPNWIEIEGTGTIPTNIEGFIPAHSYNKVYYGYEAKDAQNNTIGWYVEKSNTWVNRYEALFEINEYQPRPEWLIQLPKSEGGFVEHMKVEDDGSNVDTDMYSFFGRVKKVFIENVHKQNGEFVKVYWMSMTYGNGDETIDVMLFTNEDKSLPRWARWMILNENKHDYYGSWYIPDGLSYSQETMLDSLKNSYFVQIRTGIRKADSFDYVVPSYFLDTNGYNRESYLQSLDHEANKVFMNALVSNNFDEVGDGLRMAATMLWIYASP